MAVGRDADFLARLRQGAHHMGAGMCLARTGRSLDRETPRQLSGGDPDRSGKSGLVCLL